MHRPDVSGDQMYDVYIDGYKCMARNAAESIQLVYQLADAEARSAATAGGINRIWLTIRDDKWEPGEGKPICQSQTLYHLVAMGKIDLALTCNYRDGRSPRLITSFRIDEVAPSRVGKQSRSRRRVRA